MSETKRYRARRAYSRRADGRPSFQFYPKDWVGEDAGLRQCSLAARGLWMDLLCWMWKTSVRGLCAGDVVKIARMVGAEVEEVRAGLRELHEARVFSWVSKGSILDEGAVDPRWEERMPVAGAQLCCRRMWREHGISEARREAGRKGGLARGQHRGGDEGESSFSLRKEKEAKRNGVGGGEEVLQGQVCSQAGAWERGEEKQGREGESSFSLRKEKEAKRNEELEAKQDFACKQRPTIDQGKRREKGKQKAEQGAAGVDAANGLERNRLEIVAAGEVLAKMEANKGANFNISDLRSPISGLMYLEKADQKIDPSMENSGGESSGSASCPEREEGEGEEGVEGGESGGSAAADEAMAVRRVRFLRDTLAKEGAVFSAGTVIDLGVKSAARWIRMGAAEDAAGAEKRIGERSRTSGTRGAGEAPARLGPGMGPECAGDVVQRVLGQVARKKNFQGSGAAGAEERGANSGAAVAAGHGEVGHGGRSVDGGRGARNGGGLTSSRKLAGMAKHEVAGLGLSGLVEVAAGIECECSGKSLDVAMRWWRTRAGAMCAKAGGEEKLRECVLHVWHALHPEAGGGVGALENAAAWMNGETRDFLKGVEAGSG